jgi:hypothetical protein
VISSLRMSDLGRSVRGFARFIETPDDGDALPHTAGLMTDVESAGPPVGDRARGSAAAPVDSGRETLVSDRRCASEPQRLRNAFGVQEDRPLCDDVALCRTLRDSPDISAMGRRKRRGPTWPLSKT